MANGMQITGSLLPLKNKLDRMDKEIGAIIKKAAFRLEATMVKHLQNQDLGWEALNADYKKRKEGQKSPKVSNLVRIATNTSMETIRVMSLKKDAYFVGWPRGERGKEGEDLVEINAVHEFGSNDGTIPARPLVRPSRDEVREWVEKQLTSNLKSIFS